MQAVQASRALHARWVQPPASAVAFRLYVRRYATDALRDIAATRHIGLLAFEREGDRLAGVFNLSEIIHGALRSAFVGYYAFSSMNARGLMRDGLALTLDVAFSVLRLHRVEVNVQPTNDRSIALVDALGFTREGYSRRYVKVRGRWHDHVRYAMLVEDWRSVRPRVV
ncbi:MAG: GNAT family N-acetyltransferase [Pseudomonadota bacterium]|nr:GNAT family N-acetyltransferase [Pseudomonadota bacterium]